MKINTIYRYIILVVITLVFTQCYTERTEEITEIPFDAIEKKLEELRRIQQEINAAGVKSTGFQAEIDQLLQEINDFMPPTPPNIAPINYSLGIVSADRESEQIGISGATVSIDIGGVRTTVTTDSDGQALFDNMRNGVVMVHIDVVGYTNVSFIVDLTTATSNVSTLIALYPTTVENGAITLDGELFIDTDRTNDLAPADPGYGLIDYNTFAGGSQDYRPSPVLNFTDDVFINETQDFLDARVQSWESLTQPVNVFALVQSNAVDYGFIAPGTPGNILLAIYEEMYVSTTSDSSGTFQLIIPARGNVSGALGLSNNLRIHFSEFTGSETYVRVINTNVVNLPAGVFTTSRDREVVYSAMYGFYGGSTLTPSLYPGTPIGTDYTFDQSLVNNFTTSVWSRGANTSQKAEFFFGARSRDE